MPPNPLRYVGLLSIPASHLYLEHVPHVVQNGQDCGRLPHVEFAGGEEACKNKGLNQTGSIAVGCCHWVAFEGKCLSAVGSNPCINEEEEDNEEGEGGGDGEEEGEKEKEEMGGEGA
jgi:hypothetical protein